MRKLNWYKKKSRKNSRINGKKWKDPILILENADDLDVMKSRFLFRYGTLVVSEDDIIPGILRYGHHLRILFIREMEFGRPRPRLFNKLELPQIIVQLN